MSFQAWFVVITILVMFFLLIKEYFTPDVIFFIAVTLFIVAKILPINEAVAGFSNIGMLTIGCLYIIVGSIKQSGIFEQFSFPLLGNTNNTIIRLFRLTVPIAGLSAFLNNTPIVAVLINPIRQWCQRKGLAPSKLLIPLSYAAMLGGICTLIGTSTNLIINGMMIERNIGAMGFFEIGKIGLPCALIGIIYLSLLGNRLLPERADALEQVSENFKEYITEMRIMDGCPLIHKTIHEAGLRNLKNLFLVKIIRKGKTIPAVSPAEILELHDVLVFTGVISMIMDIQGIKNFIPITKRKRDIIDDHNSLVEVVISNRFSSLGKTIKTARFRTYYHAAVIAVHRNGERIQSKIGDIVLQQGDTLLLFVKPDFKRRWEQSKDFYFISGLIDNKQPITKKVFIPIGILIGIILLASMNIYSMFQAVLIGSSLLLITKSISPSDARKSINWQVLIIIACAIAVGKALESSGAAESISHIIIKNYNLLGPIGSLAIIYCMTNIIAGLITNSAAAVLMFPIGLATAVQLGINPRPFCFIIAIAASASFASPIGYQTNLMVYGPGGYRFNDFLKIGIPLNVLIGIIAVCCASMIWPF